MAKKPESPKPAQTRIEKFTGASRQLFDLPKEMVQKTIAKFPGDGGGIFHVAIFRFAKEHVNDATVAFRALASASRKERGNLAYNIYRGIDDDQEFYVVEHWASAAALAAHEHIGAFIHFGQGILVRYATLHDTVTASAFDVGRSASQAPPK